MDSDASAVQATKDISRKALAICTSGFVVTAVALVGMTLALVPVASRPDWFWVRLVWLVFLSALCWGSVRGFLWSSLTGTASPKGFGGVGPSMYMVTFWYSAASAVLMVAQALLSEIEWLRRMHLAIQIGMGGVASVVLLLMLVPLLQTKDAHR